MTVVVTSVVADYRIITALNSEFYSCNFSGGFVMRVVIVIRRVNTNT